MTILAVVSLVALASTVSLGLGFALGWRVRSDIPTLTRVVPTFVLETDSERRKRLADAPLGFELPDEPGS